MHYLVEKLRLIHERDSYIKQYIDNFNFLLKGLVLGVLGGMLGSSIDRQLAQLGVFYTASLAIALTLIFYFVLNSVSKKASELQKKNFTELREVDSELKAFTTSFTKNNDIDSKDLKKSEGTFEIIQK